MSNIDEQYLDDLFKGTGDKLDETAWKKAGESKRFVSFYKLDENQTGLIAFLSEGWDAMFHTVKEKIGGREQYHTILQKPQNCELNSVEKPAIRRVFMVLDLANQYEDKKNRQMIRRPQIKILMANKATKGVFEKAQMHPKQGNGKLCGMKWEVARLGSGQATVYNLQVDSALDVKKLFDERRPVETKEGLKEFAWIIQPDWPEYDTSYRAELQSVYTRKQMKPKEPMDWSNPAMVQTWIKLHFLNTPQAEYLRLSGSFVPPVADSRQDLAPPAPSNQEEQPKVRKKIPTASVPIPDPIPDDEEDEDSGW